MAYQSDQMTPERSVDDAETPEAPVADAATPGDKAYQISLDMTNPDIAEQFASCEPGETLTVVSKDDTSIVLAKETGKEPQESNENPNDMGDERPAEEEPKGAVAILMARRRKQ